VARLANVWTPFVLVKWLVICYVKLTAVINAVAESPLSQLKRRGQIVAERSGTIVPPRKVAARLHRRGETMVSCIF